MTTSAAELSRISPVKAMPPPVDGLGSFAEPEEFEDAAEEPDAADTTFSVLVSADDKESAFLKAFSFRYVL